LEKNIYSQLCSHLNANLIGAPETKEILEILRLQFTPEEAELALHLTPLPQKLSDIAQFKEYMLKNKASGEKMPRSSQIDLSIIQ
jgi:hypothetical protein